MRVIGVTGFQGTGKGVVSRFIAEQAEGTVKLVGFSDALKVLAARSLGFNRPDAELIELMDSLKRSSLVSAFYDETYMPSTQFEDNAVFQNITGRQYLQNLGEEVRRLFGAEAWVDRVLPPVNGPFTHQSALRAMHPGVDVLVLTDLRHVNEAERVKALDGQIWEVLRPGCGPSEHITEQPLPRHLVDKQIHNYGGLIALREKVADAL